MWGRLTMDCEPVEGSPIVKNLSVAILQLSEAGELAYLRSKWWASSCMADKGRSSAVQPHSLRGMFLVLSIGLGLGALAAILELTSKSRKNAVEQKVRSSSLAYHLCLAKNSNSKSTWLYTSVLVNRNFKPCRDSYFWKNNPVGWNHLVAHRNQIVLLHMNAGAKKHLRPTEVELWSDLPNRFQKWKVRCGKEGDLSWRWGQHSPTL